MNILLTGGAGYVGSHTAVALSMAGYQVVLLDNFCNSQKSVLVRLQAILGNALTCVEGDIRDTALLIKVLNKFKIDSVIHFAGLKAVGESVERPIEYYANNVHGTISLLQAMKFSNVKTMIFSSSATVYGDPQYLPLDENHPTGATNAYGRSKLHIEGMLKDIANSDPDWKIICLRYFNPVGAHESGLIYEDPNGTPNNLMPYIAQVVAGRLSHLNIYGGDYLTPDGTGVRDYIHVMDLADGHLAALEYLKVNGAWDIFNLGTGRGYSVFEIVKEFEDALGAKVPFEVVNRREGDVPISFASTEKANTVLNWKSLRSMRDICESIIGSINSPRGG